MKRSISKPKLPSGLLPSVALLFASCMSVRMMKQRGGVSQGEAAIMVRASMVESTADVVKIQVCATARS